MSVTQIVLNSQKYDFYPFEIAKMDHGFDDDHTEKYICHEYGLMYSLVKDMFSFSEPQHILVSECHSDDETQYIFIHYYPNAKNYCEKAKHLTVIREKEKLHSFPCFSQQLCFESVNERKNTDRYGKTTCDLQEKYEKYIGDFELKPRKGRKCCQKKRKFDVIKKGVFNVSLNEPILKVQRREKKRKTTKTRTMIYKEKLAYEKIGTDLPDHIDNTKFTCYECKHRCCIKDEYIKGENIMNGDKNRHIFRMFSDHYDEVKNWCYIGSYCAECFYENKNTIYMDILDKENSLFGYYNNVMMRERNYNYEPDYFDEAYEEHFANFRYYYYEEQGMLNFI